jgi:uncharacterized protein (DUF362 family)/NAD-dependent dihydropyrimidine dehydrogenase PreA subunit
MSNRVALVECQAYDREVVDAAVRRAVDLLGGIDRFVKPGERVLLKPNLLQPSPPDEAIVTHPAVLRALVLLVHEAGGQVLIADNPAVVPRSLTGWQKAYERCGWAAVAAETGAELNMHIEAKRRPHPQGDLIKLMDTSGFLDEVDVVISVPKLKTHGLMRYTGAVKNLFGTVPGATKFGYHVKLQSTDRFADMLLDLVSFVRPALTVMDAVVGMDGDGPAGGQPFPIGVVLAGVDPVALDVAALELVGEPPDSVPTIERAILRGWTTGSTSDLNLLGDDLDELRVEGFRVPAGGARSMERVPAFLRSLGTRNMVANPVVNELCIGCGLCIDSCPAQTIVEVEGRARIELGDCIRCYCCHEICPERAIDLRQPALARLMSRLLR